MSEPTTRNSSRSCAECGLTFIDASITKSGKLYPHWYSDIGKSPYHIWHKNPEIPGTWLCAGCYAIRY